VKLASGWTGHDNASDNARSIAKDAHPWITTKPQAGHHPEILEWVGGSAMA